MNIDQGSLKETPAGSLLLKIFEDSKSGVLYLKRDEILKELYIERGKIVWAASNSEVDTLANMLILQKRVEKDSLEQIKNNSKNEIELGKNLVEKGLLSLEELIDFSKIQMRKIVKSILKWGDGVYYFSKDVPANTFINLEIDLKKFVFDFVKLDLDMGFIWKGIGSFQELFLKSEDNKKIEKYDLSKAELELLDKFTGEVNVEVISLSFVGLPKEEILKTIYFFLLAGLLYKKPEVDEDDRLKVPDNLITGSKTDSSGLKNELSEIEQINLDDLNEEDIYSYDNDDKEINAKFTVKDNSDVIEDDIPGRKDISITDRMLQDLNKEETKKKSKLFNIFFILIVIAIIISGIMFLILDKGKNISEVGKKSEKSNVIADKIRQKDLKKKNAEIPALTKENIKSEKNAENIGKKSSLSISEVNKRLNGSFDKNKSEKADIVETDSESAYKYFKKGKFVLAGNIWKKKLLSSNFKFSVLLELDCQKESVRYAFKKINKKDDFFILNHERNGRNCFLVLFGRYRSEVDAIRSIDYLPKYFLNQKNPPKVLELSKYL